MNCQMRLFAMAALFVAGCATPRLPTAHGVEPERHVANGNLNLGEARMLPSVCTADDVTPEYAALDETAVANFLKKKGLPVRIERARADLFYVEVQLNPDTDEWVRLRVAILGTSAQAGRELHDAILQHGMGSWGLHRANLAVLGPEGSVSDIVRFVARTKLSCWGVLTVADRDDAFVIPGNYREL